MENNNRSLLPPTLMPTLPFLMNTIQQSEGANSANSPFNQTDMLYPQAHLPGGFFLPGAANMHRLLAQSAHLSQSLFSPTQNFMPPYTPMIDPKMALQNALTAATYAMGLKKPRKKPIPKKEKQPVPAPPVPATNSMVQQAPVEEIEFPQYSSQQYGNVQVKQEVVTPDEDDDDIEILEVDEEDRKKAEKIKETQLQAFANTDDDSPVLTITRDCVLHPLYQCLSTSCSMHKLTLGAVCQYLKISCPTWAKAKLVNSAAAIACSIAILEDNRLKTTENKMVEELKKTFRFSSMSCLARAWKIVGERCIHFEQIRRTRPGLKPRFEGNSFFNLSNEDVETAFKLSMENLSRIPPSEKDLLLFPSKRMSNISELKADGVLTVGYNNFEMCVHLASAYAPSNVRYIIMVLPEKNEWRTSCVQLQTLEQIAEEKCCQIILLCPPVYRNYLDWKENIIAFQKTLRNAKQEWIRKFSYSRVELIGLEENSRDNLDRYYGSLGVEVECYVGQEQISTTMIRHYFRMVNSELRHHNYVTTLEFSDSYLLTAWRKEASKRPGRKRKIVVAELPVLHQEEDLSQTTPSTDPAEEAEIEINNIAHGEIIE